MFDVVRVPSMGMSGNGVFDELVEIFRRLSDRRHRNMDDEGGLTRWKWYLCATLDLVPVMTSRPSQAPVAPRTAPAQLKSGQLGF